MTTDVAKAKAYYTGLFDWQLEDIPVKGYTLIKEGEVTGGGMMKPVDPDALSSWLAYMLVDDAAYGVKSTYRVGTSTTGRTSRNPWIRSGLFLYRSPWRKWWRNSVRAPALLIPSPICRPSADVSLPSARKRQKPGMPPGNYR